MSRILEFYTNGQYFKNNPTWDTADTDWKLQKFSKKIEGYLPHKLGRVWEVGCGSGSLLKKLAQQMPQHSFKGWDISPDAKRFWDAPAQNVAFEVGDILGANQSDSADIVLLIDVLEHMADPATFLEKIRVKTKTVAIHLPLDMTLINLMFDNRLVYMRDSVGHIHYYTKAVAEKMVQDAGYAIVSSEYSNAWKNSPNLSWAGKIARIFRWTLNKISPTLNAKIFGGETLILIAKPNT